MPGINTTLIDGEFTKLKTGVSDLLKEQTDIGKSITESFSGTEALSRTFNATKPFTQKISAISDLGNTSNNIN